MSTLAILGYVGNILLAIAYIPQIYKTWKSKKAEDISISMWLIYLLGETLLLLHAISLGDINFIILLCIFTLGDLAIIVLKLKYGLTKTKA